MWIRKDSLFYIYFKINENKMNIEKKERKPRNYWNYETCKEEALKYDTKKEFVKCCGSAYGYSKKNKIIDDICSHMVGVRGCVNYWNYERCKEEALKYNTKKELMYNSKRAYVVICRNKWLDDLCSHMSSLIKPNNYWSFDICKEEALKYDRKVDFENGSSVAYNKSLKNKWLNKICNHMVGGNKPKNYWTMEQCKEEALKYLYIGDFIKESPSCYTISRNNKWVNDITSHMSRKCRKSGFYTKEQCQIEALEYTSKKEFENKCSRGYEISRLNGWLKEICSHMPYQREKGYLTYEKCFEISSQFKTKGELSKKRPGVYYKILDNDWMDDMSEHMEILGNKHKRLVYVYKFKDGSIYVGLTCNFKRRSYEHSTGNRYSAVYEYSLKYNMLSCVELLTGYIDCVEASKIERKTINFYKNNGFNVLNRVGGGSLGGGNFMYDYDACKEEALKYKSRVDFKSYSSGAYENSRINGWLDSFCSHMKDYERPNEYWNNFDICKTEALKYNNIDDFLKNSNRAYYFTKKNNWLNELCSHMINTIVAYKHTFWDDIENCRKEALKYKSRTEFKNGSTQAYRKAYKNKWLDELFPNMLSVRKPDGYWDFNRCREESLKYDTRIQFRRNCGSGYQKCLLNKWLDEFFKRD